MKKFLLAVMAVMFCTAMATAQLVESRTGGAHIYKVKNPPPEMRYYLKLGGGVLGGLRSNMLTSHRIAGSEVYSTGFAADLQFGVERHFKYNSNWYWGGKIGIGLSSHSFKYPAWEEVESYSSGSYKKEKYECEGGSTSITPVNIHIGPTIGFCKPISSGIKLNIGITPEFVCFLGGKELMRCEYTSYRYNETDDGIEMDPNGVYYHGSWSRIGDCGISGTLSVDLLINKFIVGVSGKYMNILTYSTMGDGVYGAMVNIGYVF
jgi:hypothetical protein